MTGTVAVTTPYLTGTLLSVNLVRYRNVAVTTKKVIVLLVVIKIPGLVSYQDKSITMQ